MSGIQRYDRTSLSMWPSEDGLYVSYADHEAEVARLSAELQNAAKAALDAVALSCEKEREADALRVDAMRYRWLRNADNYPSPIGGFWNCLGETSEPEEMDAAIDAAMGASA